MLKAYKRHILLLTVAVVLMCILLTGTKVLNRRGDLVQQYIAVGNVVELGTFEQDNDPSNGAEPIQWIVIRNNEEDGTVTLLSLYGLTAMPYHHTAPYPTWAESDLRAWLNGDFYGTAFADEERRLIAGSYVTASDHTQWAEDDSETVDGGADTADYVYLLSTEEALKLCSVDSLAMLRTDEKKQENLRMVPSVYAADHGAVQSAEYTVDDKECSGWWFRSPGSTADSAAYAGADGLVYGNSSVTCDTLCVRPVIRIDLGAL